jgi:hypothetical protein
VQGFHSHFFPDLPIGFTHSNLYDSISSEVVQEIQILFLRANQLCRTHIASQFCNITEAKHFYIGRNEYHVSPPSVRSLASLRSKGLIEVDALNAFVFQASKLKPNLVCLGSDFYTLLDEDNGCDHHTQMKCRVAVLCDCPV